MRFHLAAAAAFLLAGAQARIDGIAAPETVKPGEDFEVFITTEDYIQSVADVAAAIGYWPNEHLSPDSLGFLLTSKYLGPDLSNIISNISITVQIPAAAPLGPALITSSVMSLYGASSSPILTPFNVSVTIGNETSKTYKRGTFWQTSSCS